MTVAFVYPGQGAQRPGMLSDLPCVPEVDQTLAEAGQLIPGGIGTLDSPASLTQTVPAQLALLVSGVAATRALAARGAAPDIVAGHSVGAFAAAVAAGALQFSEAITAVTHRARRMAELFPHGYGMLAVSGLREEELGKIAEQVTAEGHPAWLANVNSIDQMVLTGTNAALDRGRELARARGARRTDRLEVAVPSHAPILEPVSAELRSLLCGRATRPLTARYVTISTARPATTSADVLDDLTVSVSRTLRWRDAFGVITELGTRFVLQLPPGRVLVDLAQSDLESTGATRVDVRAMSDDRLEDSVYRVRRAQGR
ncbi:MAG: acyltransferase domain-containing protein [Streptosporangiaceae bacterium]